MTPGEIVSALDGMDYEESSSALERLLSGHLRGKVDNYEIRNHVEDSVFLSMYYEYLLTDSRNPAALLDEFNARFGLSELVECLYAREG